MQPIEIGILIINLVGLTVSGGLVFSLLASSNRNQLSNLFAGVSGTVALWASMSLLRSVSLSLGVDDSGVVQLNLNMMMSALLASSALYFVFVIHYADIRSRLLDMFSRVVLVATAIGVILTWVNSLFVVQPQALSQYMVTTMGFIFVGFTIGYLLMLVWLVINATTQRSPMLVRPTILFFIAYVIASFDIWTEVLSIHILLLAVALAWVGLSILRGQVVNPQVALNRDLQLTNQELQRTINDLAQEKSKTEALNIELLQANRYKDQFLATMSHELRTPLNSIVGYSELLMTNIYGELDERQSDRLERIHRNGRHLTDVINAILDLNKIDSGRMQLDVTEFSLIDVIQSIGEQFKPEDENPPIELIIHVPDELPDYRGDKQRIEQVIQIILDNAFKFTAEGQVQVTLNYVIIHQGQSDSFKLPTIGWLKDGHWGIIEFKDTGIGIAPEDQGKIFDRFSQVDSSRTRDHEGIGLGLTIARKLVELHDGMIWVKSQVGHGSTFYVALPFQSVVVKSSEA